MLTKTKLSDWIHRDLDILILPIAFVVITVILGILNPDKFLTGNNISAMAFQIPELGLFTFAMMIAMITGGINLSIISTANLTGICMAILMTGFSLPICLRCSWGSACSASLSDLHRQKRQREWPVNRFCRNPPVLTTIGTMALYAKG